jgi:hypothetical protein
VAVVTAPLLKSGRRKIRGAMKNSGPQGAVKGPWKGQKGSKGAVGPKHFYIDIQGYIQLVNSIVKAGSQHSAP